MNCLFINYSGYPKGLNYFCPDNGLALLSTILNRGNQHRAFVLDYCSTYYTDLWGECWKNENENPIDKHQSPYYNCLNRVLTIISEEVLDFIKSNDIHVVGFKLWTGEGFRGSSNLARIIKERIPKVHVLAGGPHIDYFGNYIYEDTDAFDCLISKDGEISLIQLLNNINNRNLWFSVPNLIFKYKGKVITTPKEYIGDLNENPTPEYLPETYIHIKDKLNFFIIEDTRGCPYNCNYCIEPIKSGNTIRSRNVELIVEDIARTKVILKSKGFRFSCSTPHKAHRMKLATKLIAEKLDLLYATFQTVKNFDADYALLIKKSGCYNVFIGVESFSEKVLTESYGKKQSFEEISNAIRVSKDANLYTQIGLIYPSPIEDSETKEITLSTALKLRPDSIFVLCPIVTPYTKWGSNPVTFNIHTQDASGYYHNSMNYDIKHTGDERKWSQLNGIIINGRTYDELISEMSILLESIRMSDIETQISIELPILAHFSGKTAQILNQSCHQVLNDFDTHSLKSMIAELNKHLCYD
jgi:organic radical activating enzyme